MTSDTRNIEEQAEFISIIGEMDHTEVIAVAESMDAKDLAMVMNVLPKHTSEALLIYLGLATLFAVYET